LEQVADPDAVVEHHPATCGGCGAGLDGVVSVGYRARQVFDLPKIAPEVTEHRLHRAVCGCGHTTKPIATATGQAGAGTVYGGRGTSRDLLLVGLPSTCRPNA
jgi:transposase